MNLQNKIAIVTGASKGIGKAIALALLSKGVKVATWNRTNPNIDNPNCLFVKCDVARQSEVQNAYAETVQAFGEQIDILVNNAGLGYFGKIEETPWDAWQQMFDVNVHGVYHCTRAVLPLMKAQKRGHLVNIASIAALNGVNEASGYVGTKHAVRGISHSIYPEVKKDNIKVTVVYPGSVKTEFFNNINSINANPTMLHPEDIANLIVNVLETPDNFNTLDLEIRPMNPVYK